ncbi:hypothetical protein AAG570_002910 [Ranatra chinensis]|uniref:Uncharacterized protein n=1 Tax=Ranatra chinensis TaxID=642074 RepID=A0ABD0Y5C0_9HEMI
MASELQNMFYETKKQETTEIGALFSVDVILQFPLPHFRACVDEVTFPAEDGIVILVQSEDEMTDASQADGVRQKRGRLVEARLTRLLLEKQLEKSTGSKPASKHSKYSLVNSGNGGRMTSAPRYLYRPQQAATENIRERYNLRRTYARQSPIS